MGVAVKRATGRRLSELLMAMLKEILKILFSESATVRVKVVLEQPPIESAVVCKTRLPFVRLAVVHSSASLLEIVKM